MPGQKTSGGTGRRICLPRLRALIRSPPAAWTWPGKGCRCGPIPRRSPTWPRCGSGWRIATATSSTSSPGPTRRRQARKRPGKRPLPASFPSIPRSRAATASSAPRRPRLPHCSPPGPFPTCGTARTRTRLLTPSGPSSVSASLTSTRKCPWIPRSTSPADCGHRASGRSTCRSARVTWSAARCALTPSRPAPRTTAWPTRPRGKTINFTVEPGSRRRHRRGRRLPRRLGPPQPRARPLRGRLLRRDLSPYNTNGHQPFPASSNAVMMVDQNGTTLARPNMLTDYAFKTIFVAA